MCSCKGRPKGDCACSIRSITDMSQKIAVLDDGTRVRVTAKKDGENTVYAAIDPPEDFNPWRITHYEEA